MDKYHFTSQVLISDNKDRLQIDLIHHFLSSKSRWAKGISKDLVMRSIKNSLCFGAYWQEQQIGFCRVISDYVTFANLVDVFVVDEMRGAGVSKLLLQNVMGHSLLQGLRRMTLVTCDAHGLYKQFGFKGLDKPQNFMEIHNLDGYRTLAE